MLLLKLHLKNILSHGINTTHRLPPHLYDLENFLHLSQSIFRLLSICATLEYYGATVLKSLQQPHLLHLLLNYRQFIGGSISRGGGGGTSSLFLISSYKFCTLSTLSIMVSHELPPLHHHVSLVSHHLPLFIYHRIHTVYRLHQTFYSFI